MKLGSRIFSPRPFTTAVTLALLGVLLMLGRWQLRRADEKRALYDAFDKGTQITQKIDAHSLPVARYRHVEAQGRYDGSRQILIDNMTDAEGHAGYFVLTPFALSSGGWLMINRGWIALGQSRATLPSVSVGNDLRTVRGRTDHLPAPGIRMGHPVPMRPPFPIVANFPSRGDLAQVVPAPWPDAPDLVLLDADQPDGYVRQWHAPGFPPLRHIAYAVQWFGLAVALAVIYVLTNVRRAA